MHPLYAHFWNTNRTFVLAVEMRSKGTTQGFVVPGDSQELPDWHRGMDLVDLAHAIESVPISQLNLGAPI